MFRLFCDSLHLLCSCVCDCVCSSNKQPMTDAACFNSIQPKSPSPLLSSPHSTLKEKYCASSHLFLRLTLLTLSFLLSAFFYISLLFVSFFSLCSFFSCKSFSSGSPSLSSSTVPLKCIHGDFRVPPVHLVSSFPGVFLPMLTHNVRLRLC